jgi:hypothetical protein
MNSSDIFSWLESRPNFSCPVSKMPDNCTVWIGTKDQWHMQTVGAIILCFSAVFANLLNLLVFYHWRIKEPHVFFHVSLAVNSILTGILGSLAPISRCIDWTRPTRWLFKVSVGGVLLFQFTTFVNVAVISIDRWLSVEFVAHYHLSRKKILLAIGLIYCLAVLHSVPPLVVYQDCILLFCSRQPAFRWKGQSYVLWSLSRGPLLLMMIMLTQARICIIVIKAKFRLLRNRRVRRWDSRDDIQPNIF